MNNAEKYLTALVAELEVPSERYEQANRSYQSFGQWLHRSDSTLIKYKPDVYLQGSFKLGTVIQPQATDDEYDIDAVCLLSAIEKTNLSQSKLKTLLENEVRSYRKSQSMTKPVEEKTRCWRLSYADGAQFHMDLLPAIPNEIAMRKMLEASGLKNDYADTAIAITCTSSPTYNIISDDWPRSNPKGYYEWFKSRMEVVFNEQRTAMLEKLLRKTVTASIEDIPEYAVRTPLQSAIMVLKFHRDKMFEKRDPELKPISVIITTLAAHAYNGEETIGAAVSVILEGMKKHIRQDGTKHVIVNPTDPLENFADKWELHPERRDAFYEWLDAAKRDFLQILPMENSMLINEHVAPSLGASMAKRVMARTAVSAASSGLLQSAAAASSAGSAVSFGSEPRVPTGPQDFA